MPEQPIREWLREQFLASHERQRLAVEARMGRPSVNLRTDWLEKVEKLDRGEAIGVYFVAIMPYLNRQQLAMGGRWIVQEDGSLMKDL